MPKKEKQDGKLTAWIKAKWEALSEWYRKPDNVLRVVRFPGTKLPLLDVLIDFFKFFTKGRTTDRAAGVAFNFFVALFPLILFFFTLIPYIPIPHLYDRLMFTLDDFLIPSGTLNYVKDTIDGIMNQPHDGLLSVSVFLCLIFGSSGIVAIFNGFRNVYANYLTDKRMTMKDWIVQRMFAILMLLVIGALLVVSVLLISLGGMALKFLVTHEIIEGGSFTFFIFSVLRWVIGVFALSFGIALLYYFGNVRFGDQYRIERKRKGTDGQILYRNFVIFSPGTILATALFVLGAVAFNIYISNFSHYNVLYGSIGTLIILLLWIWIIAILILAGNDLNSSIRQRADKRSTDDQTRRKQIVIDDLRKHILAYQQVSENQQQQIDNLRKSIETQAAFVKDLEEKNKDYALIIKAYEEFAEAERQKIVEPLNKND